MINFNLKKNLLDQKFLNIIDFYQKDIIINQMLKDAIHNGKRLRSILLICLLEHHHLEYLYHLALIVELYHSCSLVIDDLPCMDNDDYRRGELSFHKKYGIEKSYYFIGYVFHFIGLIIDDQIKDEKLLNQLKLIINKNLGINGAILGQYLDLTPNSFNYKNEKEFIKLLDKKTTTFFNLSFEIANLFNNFNLKKIPYHFGLAFQLYDDFIDYHQDYQKLNNDFVANYIIIFSKEKGFNLFNKSINYLLKNLLKFKINSCSKIIINEIIDYLIQKVNLVYPLL